MYAYSWYQMFAIMLAAGVAIFIILRSLDMALQWFLDRMLARRDRKLNEMSSAAHAAAKGLSQMADHIRKAGRRG